MVFAETGWGFQNGTPGTNGDPATDGHDAPDQSPLLIQVDSHSATSWNGAHGGRGGYGGQGVDGPDSDATAAGGDGGDGGNGATLIVSNLPEQRDQIPFLLELLAGNGGRAGAGGGSVGLPSGQGGDAGNGGDVTLDLFTSKSFSVYATAGNGGDANGFQSVSGNGGSIVSRVWSAPPIHANLNDAIFQRQELRGGNGGTGRYYARGGDGGNVVNLIGGGMVTDKADNLLIVKANGGSGGVSFGGRGGDGGHVTSSWSELAFPESVKRFGMQMELRGGNGGDSNKYKEVNQQAGNGGDAIYRQAEETSIVVPSGYMDVQMQVVAGNGGHSNGWGNGGNGGTAGIERLAMSTGADPQFSQVMLQDVYLQAGDGGDSVKGNGGNGGGVYQPGGVLKYLGEAYVDLSLSAVGGNGGQGAVGGDGGHVILAMDFGDLQHSTGTNPPADLRSVNIEYRAYAGHSGTKGQGGVADVTLRASTQSRKLTLRGEAYGGQGGGVQGGTATVRVEGVNTRETHSNVDVFAKASPRRRVSALPPEIGTESLAIAQADNVIGGVRAHAVSVGGFGTIRSGISKALARSSSDRGGATSISDATALASNAPAASTTRFAYAESLASSSESRADASSTTFINGHYSFGRSNSVASGTRANASATAKSQSKARRHFAEVVTQVLGSEQTASGQSATASSQVMFRRVEPPQGQFLPVLINRTDLYLGAGIESLIDIESSALGDTFDFSDPTNDVFSATHFNSAAQGSPFQQVSSSIEIAHFVNPWETDHDVSAFFYNVEYFGDGNMPVSMKLVVRDTLLFDEQFVSGDEAVAFLDNSVFTVDRLDGLTVLSTDLEVSFGQAGDQGFRFSLGIAELALNTGMGPSGLQTVPEPGSFWLLGASSLSMLFRRQRRTTA